MTDTERAVPAIRLTRREREVLELLAEGKPAKEVALLLFVSIRTVNFHAGNIFERLGVHNRIQAIREAERLGLLGTPQGEGGRS